MNEFKLRIVSLIGRFLVITVGKSIRIKNVGEFAEGKAIYAFWHSDFFPLIYAHRFKNMVGLVSPHRDGEYLTRVIRPLGYKVVRGASGDEGAKGAIRILRLKDSNFVIAPDGPTGPAYQVKDGILKLAELTGLPIVPVGVGISKFIRFGSWDRFKLPLLFSRCVVYFKHPIWVKKSTEDLRVQVESELIDANLQANLLL